MYPALNMHINKNYQDMHIKNYWNNNFQIGNQSLFKRSFSE